MPDQKPMLPLGPLGTETYRALGPVMTNQSPKELMHVMKRGSKKPLGAYISEVLMLGESDDNNLLYSQMEFMHRYFWMGDLQDKTPSWFRPQAFMKEIMRLNGPKIWEQLMKQSDRYGAGHKGRLPKPDGFNHVYGLGWEGVQNTVYNNFHAITHANANFLTIGIISVGLGAIMGPEYASVVRNQNNQFAKAGIASASLFETQASSANEAIERLKTVYAQHAYKILHAQNAFDLEFLKEGGIRRCPMRFEPTEHFVQAIALLLDDNLYKKHFRKEITRGFIRRRRDYSPVIPSSE